MIHCSPTHSSISKHSVTRRIVYLQFYFVHYIKSLLQRMSTAPTSSREPRFMFSGHNISSYIIWPLLKTKAKSEMHWMSRASCQKSALGYLNSEAFKWNTWLSPSTSGCMKQKPEWLFLHGRTGLLGLGSTASLPTFSYCIMACTDKNPKEYDEFNTLFCFLPISFIFTFSCLLHYSLTEQKYWWLRDIKACHFIIKCYISVT